MRYHRSPSEETSTVRHHAEQGRKYVSEMLSQGFVLRVSNSTGDGLVHYRTAHYLVKQGSAVWAGASKRSIRSSVEA